MAMRRHQKSALVVVCAVVLVGIFNLGGITTASGQGDEIRLDATLSGDQEVPPADPDGTGRAKVELKPAEEQVCFAVSFRNIGTPNRGHIHQGVAGMNGDIVVEFFELVAIPSDPRHDELEDRSRLEGCVPASLSILNAIAANPAGFYVNLHNARFPAGAIRGQLEE
jgi:CHRD domain